MAANPSTQPRFGILMTIIPTSRQSRSNMDEKDELVTLAGGEVAMWIEQDSSIHIKASSPHGDPVELNAEEARQRANELLRLAGRIE